MWAAGGCRPPHAGCSGCCTRHSVPTSVCTTATCAVMKAFPTTKEIGAIGTGLIMGIEGECNGSRRQRQQAGPGAPRLATLRVPAPQHQQLQHLQQHVMHALFLRAACPADQLLPSRCPAPRRHVCGMPRLAPPPSPPPPQAPAPKATPSIEPTSSKRQGG